MPMQTAADVLAAIKRETTAGVAAGAGAGAMQLRLLDSPGLRLERSAIRSNERRNDLLTPMGRLGGRSVGGSYNSELTIGGATDSLIEAIQRGVWLDALAVPQDTFGAGATITFATSGTDTTMTLSAGSWIDQGFRVGDVITPTGLATVVANNNLRLRVVAVTDLVLTVAGVIDVGVDAGAYTITRLKKIISPANPTRYSYSIEQYDEIVDLSELFLGCRLVGLGLSFRPNAMATISYTFVGMDRTLLVVGTSPWYTDPDLTSGQPVVSDDSAIRSNGVDVAKYTGLDLNFAIANSAPNVIGSTVPPDVFDGVLGITGTVTGIREDFSRANLLEAETEFELSALFTEPGTLPKNCFGLYLPRVKFMSLDAPFLGGEGPKIETLNIEVAPHPGSAVIDASACNFFSSAP